MRARALKGKDWPLPDPAAVPFTDQVQQRLKLSHNGDGTELLAVLAPVPGGLSLAGLSPAGQRFLLITWDKDGLRAEKSPLLPAEVDPGQILRDVVLAHWPLASLRTAFAGSAWTVEEQAGGTRVLSEGGKAWLRVEPQAHGRKVLHLQQHYQVEAEDLDDDSGER